jgi:hypothetical protein
MFGLVELPAFECENLLTGFENLCLALNNLSFQNKENQNNIIESGILD